MRTHRIRDTEIMDAMDDTDRLGESESIENASIATFVKRDLDFEASRETIAIRRMLRFFVAVLAVATGCIAVAASIMPLKRAFEREFSYFAAQAVSSLQHKIETTISLLDSFAYDSVALAETSGETWPYIEDRSFLYRASKLMSVSPAVLLAHVPIVTDEEKSAYGNFTRTNTQWVRSSRLNISISLTL